MKNHLFRLDPKRTGLLIVDVQEKLFPYVDRAELVATRIDKLVELCQVMELPIIVTEQYPQGLGMTIPELRERLGPNQTYYPKTTFSAVGDPVIKEELFNQPDRQWIVVGIEAHVCILQTTCDLLQQGAQVVVVNDGISSRSIYDFSSAIAEMRDFGARISSTETVLFELVGDSKAAGFQTVSNLVKAGA